MEYYKDNAEKRIGYNCAVRGSIKVRENWFLWNSGVYKKKKVYVTKHKKKFKKRR